MWILNGFNSEATKTPSSFVGLANERKA